jgi:hypothetical protein
LQSELDVINALLHNVFVFEVNTNTSASYLDHRGSMLLLGWRVHSCECLLLMLRVQSYEDLLKKQSKNDIYLHQMMKYIFRGGKIAG